MVRMLAEQWKPVCATFYMESGSGGVGLAMSVLWLLSGQGLEVGLSDRRDLYTGPNKKYDGLEQDDGSGDAERCMDLGNYSGGKIYRPWQ